MSVLRYSRGVLQVFQECFLCQVFILVVSQGTSWKFHRYCEVVSSLFVLPGVLNVKSLSG